VKVDVYHDSVPSCVYSTQDSTNYVVIGKVCEVPDDVLKRFDWACKELAAASRILEIYYNEG
jgi:hypothetical protein